MDKRAVHVHVATRWRRREKERGLRARIPRVTANLHRACAHTLLWIVTINALRLLFRQRLLHQIQRALADRRVPAIVLAGPFHEGSQPYHRWISMNRTAAFLTDSGINGCRLHLRQRQGRDLTVGQAERRLCLIFLSELGN